MVVLPSAADSHRLDQGVVGGLASEGTELTSGQVTSLEAILLSPGNHFGPGWWEFSTNLLTKGGEVSEKGWREVFTDLTEFY